MKLTSFICAVAAAAMTFGSFSAPASQAADEKNSVDFCRQIAAVPLTVTTFHHIPKQTDVNRKLPLIDLDCLLGREYVWGYSTRQDNSRDNL